MYIKRHNKLIKNKPYRLMKKLNDLIDIKKILKNGEILIEPVQGGFLYYNSETGDMEKFDIDSYNHADMDRSVEQTIELLQYISGHVLYNTKYANYRVSIEKEINNDDDFDKVDEIVGKEVREKLYEEGYEIVKIFDNY
jgi:hypothetical protein